MTSLAIRPLRAAALFALLFFVGNALTAHAQNRDAVTDLAAHVNRERVARGLAPLALNVKLTAAAQSHADDIARAERVHSPQAGHIGSDGSSVFDRVARTGYGAYSWGRRLGENWAWYHNTSEAMTMWMDSAPHRNNILHQHYREMGIGITATLNGSFVYVIDFGAQPSVLPIFINDGAGDTRSLDVKITLTNEEVAPNGDGDNIGRAVQVMISNASDFAGAKWQPFVQTINWMLAPNGGTKTVYVEFRDAKGRTVTASDSIVVGPATLPTITPTRATPTRTPTRGTPRPVASATSVPTEMPTRVATEIVSTDTPTATTGAIATVTEIVTPGLTRAAVADSDEAGAVPNLAVLGAFGLTVALIAFSAVKDWTNR